jgi:hypothetical protein
VLTDSISWRSQVRPHATTARAHRRGPRSGP